MLHPVLLGRTGEAEPALGSRREGQTQQAAEATSGAERPQIQGRTRLRPQTQRTPSGRSRGEEPTGRGKARRDVGRGIS